ncbi:hypothetical protein PTTG_31030, partial [Puccinia triticina 1-1 BBBD Race 1]
MSTRRNTAPEDITPISDPDAIIRAANAKKRLLKQLASSSDAALKSSDSDPSSSSSSDDTVRPFIPPTVEQPADESTSYGANTNPLPPLSAPPAPSAPPLPSCSPHEKPQPSNPSLMDQPQRDQGGNPPPDYMKMLVDAQLATVEQARKDRHAAREEREANAKRMA